MQVDFKISVWERVEVPEEKKEMVLKALKNGEVSTANELLELIDDATYFGKMDDTEEDLTPADNNDNPTIDVLNENGETIWQNVEN